MISGKIRHKLRGETAAVEASDDDELAIVHRWLEVNSTSASTQYLFDDDDWTRYKAKGAKTGLQPEQIPIPRLWEVFIEDGSLDFEARYFRLKRMRETVGVDNHIKLD